METRVSVAGSDGIDYAQVMELTVSQKQAVTKKMALAYGAAGRSEKTRILDELVELTGWNRGHARDALKAALVIKEVRLRPGRAPVYGASVVATLVVCWKLSRCPAGKRLAPMLALVVPLFRRDGDLDITDEDAQSLTSMSAATIDRLLAPERAKLGRRGRSHTKPGSLLKSQIPIRTWAEWDPRCAGFVEIDLVGHEGGNASGEHCFTLTVTDVLTGWTINRSVKNKAAIWVMEALEYVVEQFPFPIRGIDCDNGSEFINAHLLAYCEANKITFTRARAGNKNDGCYVEQKNWTHVRELVGYLRYDTDAELKKLNEIWERNAFYTNYFQAQQKLVSKTRNGAKVTKKYDEAQTPHQRASAPRIASKQAKTTMSKTMATLKPGELFRDIQQLCSELESMALIKAPAPVKPRVNRAFVG